MPQQEEIVSQAYLAYLRRKRDSIATTTQAFVRGQKFWAQRKGVKSKEARRFEASVAGQEKALEDAKSLIQAIEQELEAGDPE